MFFQNPLYCRLVLQDLCSWYFRQWISSHASFGVVQSNNCFNCCGICFLRYSWFILETCSVIMVGAERVRGEPILTITCWHVISMQLLGKHFVVWKFFMWCCIYRYKVIGTSFSISFMNIWYIWQWYFGTFHQFIKFMYYSCCSVARSCYTSLVFSLYFWFFCILLIHLPVYCQILMIY